MKKKFLGLLLACALFTTAGLAVGLTACGKGNNNGNGNDKGDDKVLGITETEWNMTVEEFITESGVTAELQLFAGHFKDFTFADGKYTAGEIASTGGFTCKNIVITVDGDKIVKVEYELRTLSTDTPDRIITIDKNGIVKTDVPKPSDNTQMDEEEWKKQAAVFATTTNYSLGRVRVSSGKDVASMKLDGTTYYETWEGRERIWDIENSKYVLYEKASATAAWIKENTTQVRYENALFDPTIMVTVAAEAIENNFAALSFKAGVYSAAQIEIEYSEPFVLKDVEITVSGGKIVRVICTLVGGYDEEGDERITVDHVGSTEIAIPQNYTDNTQSGSEATGSETNEKMWLVGLSSADNFTLKNSVDIPNQGVMIVTFKVDGNKCEQTQSDGTRFVGVKEESGFAQYDYNADNDTWYKVKETSIAQFVYETNLTFPAQLAKHFDDFTFANGKYTCANIEITYMNAPAPATSLEVVFAENKPVSIKFMLTVNNQTALYEFSAFGTTEVEVPTENIVDDTQQGGTGSVVLTKDTDFGALVSDVVTEDQWRAAFSDSSFDNSTIEWNSVYSVQDSRTAYRKCMMEGDNKYVSGYVEGEYATYVTYEDGKMYMYSQSGDGKYTRSELEKTSWDLYIAYTLICPDFRDCYSQFTYNKDTGAYEYHGTGIESNAPMEPDPDWTMTYVNIQIKFSGGKLAYISCDRVYGEEDTDHFTFKCYDYGNTDFDLPTDLTDVEGGSGSEIGSEMWDESLASADNFTVTLAVKLADTDDSPMATMLAIRADGDKVEQEQANGMRIIVVKEEKSYTQYATEDGDSWVRQTESQEAAQLFVAYMSFPKLFMGHFADFTYQDGKYVCEELQIDSGDETARFLNIEIVFVDNQVYSIAFSTNESDGSATYYTLNAFGTTEVKVPTENVEDVGGSGSEQGGTGSEVPSIDLEGKTFAYSRCEGMKDATDEDLAAAEAHITQLGNITVTFGQNNTVHVEMGSMVTEDGTYTVEGNVVTLHIETIMMGSVPMEEGATIECIFDGTNFLMPSEDENNRVYFVLVEQEA